MKAIKKIFLFIILIALIIITIVGYKGYKMYKNAINETPIQEKIEKIKQEENYTQLNNISTNFINAIIAIEDHRFYTHKGIDLISVIKAILTDLKQNDIITGGSSITQQLAKNMYFDQEKEFKRKVAEIFIVSYLEDNLTKDEILEIYLNTIYYGNGYYGIGNAAKGYFNKEPKDLTLNEATILAGMPKAPSIYSQDKEQASIRQKQVLEAMEKYNYIAKDDITRTINEGN